MRPLATGLKISHIPQPQEWSHHPVRPKANPSQPFELPHLRKNGISLPERLGITTNNSKASRLEQHVRSALHRRGITSMRMLSQKKTPTPKCTVRSRNPPQQPTRRVSLYKPGVVEEPAVPQVGPETPPHRMFNVGNEPPTHSCPAASPHSIPPWGRWHGGRTVPPQPLAWRCLVQLQRGRHSRQGRSRQYRALRSGSAVPSSLPVFSLLSQPPSQRGAHVPLLSVPLSPSSQLPGGCTHTLRSHPLSAKQHRSVPGG